MNVRSVRRAPVARHERRLPGLGPDRLLAPRADADQRDRRADVLGDEPQVVLRRGRQVGEACGTRPDPLPSGQLGQLGAWCGARPTGGRGSPRTPRPRRRDSSCTPRSDRIPRARRAWSSRAPSACSGVRRSAARRDPASRCAAGDRSSCRTRRRALGSAPRSRRAAHWGTAPRPTRVVYALEMPQISSMSFGPTPVPTHAAPDSGFDEVTNG